MRPLFAWLLLALAIAVIGAFFGWAFYASGGLAGAEDSGPALWAIFIGGVALTGGLTGFFMWLAFYSSRHGYDASADPWRDREP